MRVIAGKYKGRQLVSPAGSVARPTADRVKEALFGAIQFQIKGMRVLDAFAGSGALGIEALSRGAAHVDFVEKDKRCVAVLRKNIDTIGAKNCAVYHGDILTLLPRLNTYDLLLADPPYDSELYEPLLGAAHTRAKLNSGAIIVLETRKKFDFMPPLGYNFTKRADYGDTSLWFLAYGEKT